MAVFLIPWSDLSLELSPLWQYFEANRYKTCVRPCLVCGKLAKCGCAQVSECSCMHS
jgi:hypothetical protein